jgi:hypothetical protein
MLYSWLPSTNVRARQVQVQRSRAPRFLALTNVIIILLYDLFDVITVLKGTGTGMQSPHEADSLSTPLCCSKPVEPHETVCRGQLYNVLMPLCLK